MNPYTPAEMHTFAEYALEHVYKLNTHTPKTMQFDTHYSPIAVTVSLYFLSEDGWNVLRAEHADIYRHSSKTTYTTRFSAGKKDTSRRPRR